MPHLGKLLALSVLFASTAHAHEECKLGGKPVSLADYHTFEGRTGTITCREESTRELTSENEVRDGKLIGFVREYYQGAIRSEYSISTDGMKEGVIRHYAATKPKNQLLREEEIRDGWRVGRLKVFYPNGRLKTVAAYVTGQRNPIARVEFTEHGELTHLTCTEKPVLGMDFNDAVLCGHGSKPNTVELFTSQGVKYEQATLSQGKRIREERFWQSGKLRSQSEWKGTEKITRTFSEDGQKVSESREPGTARTAEKYYPGGTREAEQRWEKDRLMFERTFYMNGQPKTQREIVRLEAREVRRESNYHDTGVLASEGAWSLEASIPVGVHKVFDAQGKLSAELYYDPAGVLTRERRFDVTGRVTDDDQLFPDGSRKRFKR